MRMIMFLAGVCLCVVGLRESADLAVSPEVASKITGAACGYSTWYANAQTCDKNDQGQWTCGPELNISVGGGSGDKLAKPISCGAGCSGQGSGYDTCSAHS